jgi:NAD-dependent SIR2 family protein deacetylase
MLRAERRHVVPFIGAGLSVEAGVPAADPLARLIAEKANKRGRRSTFDPTSRQSAVRSVSSSLTSSYRKSFPRWL